MNFVTKKLRNVQNKKAVQGCRDTLKENLRKFREIKDTSQVVRNDMTNAEQRRLSLRIANQRKLKEILHVSKGSGRTCKCEENLCLSLFWNTPSWKPIFVNEEGEAFKGTHAC